MRLSKLNRGMMGIIVLVILLLGAALLLSEIPVQSAWLLPPIERSPPFGSQMSIPIFGSATLLFLFLVYRLEKH